mmetsp:Transcript_27560/g.46263  ORF Transcript_27560/g.46263 Transcript_27560/m.46263 type:complete len:271 (-) Transcript_27560:201-1013(-)
MHLTHLQLKGCTRIGSEGISAIAQHCPHLRCLLLEHTGAISDTAVTLLAQGCPLLTHVCFGEQVTLTEAALVFVAHSCVHLRRIELDLQPFRIDTSDLVIISLCEYCPSLEYISLTHCAYLSDTAVFRLAHSCCGAKLRHLSIDGARYITDASIVALSQQSGRFLRHLELSDCQSLTDTAGLAIAQHCSGLHYVNLSYNRSITGATVIALATHCKQLLRIHLYCNLRITDASVLLLAQNCSMADYKKRCHEHELAIRRDFRQQIEFIGML